VQQHRPVDILDHLQVLAQLADIVAVDGAHVADAQFLEQHSAVQPRLDRLFGLPKESFDRVAQERHFVQRLVNFLLQAGIKRRHSQAVEVFRKAAHSRADRHLVVVQDHQQLLL
jgi:hypothetical protein